MGSKHYPDLETAISDGEFFGDIVYIASDHSSHTKHAVISSNNFTTTIFFRWTNNSIIINNNNHEFIEFHKGGIRIGIGYCQDGRADPVACY